MRIRIHHESWNARKLVAFSGIVMVFLLLAFDGRFYWDEAAYLYIGAFLDHESIFRGEFIGGLYISRLLHIALVAGIASLVGPGVSALVILISFYLAIWLLFQRIAYAVLKSTLTTTDGLVVAVVGAMFTPIYLYLAFKTLPEIPGLTMSAIAASALLSAFAGRPLTWLPVVSLSLAVAAFFKPETTLLYTSFVATLFLLGSKNHSRGRLVGYAFVSGVGSLVVFAAGLWMFEIDLGRYLKVGAQLLQRDEPLVAKLFFVALEGGLFFLAIPLAFMSKRRRDVWFCLVWFLLASLPLPLMIAHFEPRYLAPNLIALTGLIYLAVDALKPRIAAWRRRRPIAASCTLGLGILVTIGSNRIVLSVMPHEVHIFQLRQLIARLDQTYSHQNYTILTPYSYTEFHFLRFVYPNRSIYTVQSVFNKGNDDRLYYEKRNIASLAELKLLDNVLVYLGFGESFAVENLRTIVGAIPVPVLVKQFEGKTFQDHLTLSWMWGHPDIVFERPLREGHYVAYQVQVR